MEQQHLQREEPGAEAAPLRVQAESVPREESVPRSEEAAVGALLAAFQQETRRYRRRIRNGLALGTLAAASVMLLDVFALLGSLQAETFPFTIALLGWGMDLVVLLSCLAYPVTAFQARKRVAERLARFDDLRIVGPLAEMLEAPDMRARPDVVSALTTLLPRLQASDAALLDTEQRACLCRILTSSERALTDLKIAILRAFEQVGDSRALPLVERLAEGPGRTERQRRIRSAAKHCLPFLQERAAQEPFRQTLLRASLAAGVASDTLLRPAAPGVDAAAQHLLRASVQEEAAAGK
ncbi:MAG TPA: hypothetical protein VFB21_08610 [Chthonomonadaceae bacterium]|nr:hypothetical protein [Chthonomonadaceae bacterium]